MALAEFYNGIYKKSPNLWRGSQGRDEFVVENIEQPKSVIDIGCGNGHTLKHLSTVWKGTKLCGVDISRVAIDIAQEKVPEAKFVVGTIRDVVDRFDVALVMGVAEHFRDIYELGRVKNVLNPGGLVYLEIPNCLSYAQDKTEGFRKEGTQEEWHLKRETWELIIKEHGYEIVKSLVGKKPAWEFIWILKGV